MEKNKFRDMDRFENIKDLIYNSAEKYAKNVAFTTKVINGKEVEYEETTYEKFLEEINYLGTAFFNLGLEER